MKSPKTGKASEIMQKYSSLLRHPSSIIFIAALALAVAIIPLFIMQRTAAKEATNIRTKLTELSVLSTEYRSIRDKIASLEQRKSLRKVTGVPQAIDEISSSVGLKGKVRGVKAIGSRDIPGGTEESAEVQIEKVTINELVNILHAIDDAPIMLSIKRTAIKKTFEDPRLFNATLTLSLFQKK